MKLLCFNHPELSQFLHVWPIQKEHIVVQYSLDLNKPLCTRNSLFLELSLERLLFQFALVTNDHDIKSVPRLKIQHPPVQQNML